MFQSNTDRLRIVGLVLGVIVILAGAWFFTRTVNTPEDSSETVMPEEDPVDVVGGFYRTWLEAALSTTTDPYAAGLVDDPGLSTEVQEYIKTLRADVNALLDPVLCYESVIPAQFRTKTVFTQDDEAQVLVLLRDGDLIPRQALVTLGVANAKWQVTEIRCMQGEQGPEREFSFEKDGFLLKNVPPPYNSEYWHIVFEEEGVKGHVAPLFFGEGSICVKTDGSESVCDQGTFTPASAVHIQGEMSEVGVEVKRLELLE